MDSVSEFTFESVLNKTTQVTVDVLKQLFDNIFKDYKPLFHPMISGSQGNSKKGSGELWLMP
jgi:hypothetical protein